MPAPIVLSTLTPETKRVPNPPEGQPVIATKADLRDGTRLTSDPVDPPPSSVDGTLHPGAFALTDAEWKTRLESTAQNFTTGTDDPTFDPRTDITYVGAFRINYFSGARQMQALAFNPPNGNNGPNGSVFIGGSDGISEIQIPDLSATDDGTQLPGGTRLGGKYNPYENAPANGGQTIHWNGWLKVIGGRLYSSWYANYSTTYKNIYNLVVSQDASDHINGGQIGAFHMTSDPSVTDMFDEDHVIRYCGDIPADKRAMFGGDTHFAGISADISIVSRSSYGPAFYGFSPASVTASDTVVPTTKWLRYPNTNAIPGWSGDNPDIVAHYESEVGSALETYVNSPTSGRETSFGAFPIPSESLRKHLATYENRVGCAFIPPGSNSVVLIGSVYGMRFGTGYKCRTIEFGPDGPGAGGYRPFSEYDRDNVFWTLNLSDIANTATNEDVAYSDFGIFDNNRWRKEVAISNANDFYRPGPVTGGDFDPATGRLYLFQQGAWPASSFYERDHLVSVYQVGAPV